MTIIDNEMLWRQFGAAIDMLNEALRDCPDELWEKRLWEDQPDQWVAAGFSTFWYLGCHTLFWLDLYLTGAEEGFAPPEPFDLVEMDVGSSCRAPTLVKNCSTIWNIVAENARKQLAQCQTNRLTGCASSRGESRPSQSYSCTICVMCRSTAHSCACSWDSRRGNPQVGHPRLSKNLLSCSASPPCPLSTLILPGRDGVWLQWRGGGSNRRVDHGVAPSPLPGTRSFPQLTQVERVGVRLNRYKSH